MILEAILSATLEAGLGFLMEAGFGDAARDVRQRLSGAGEKKHRQALEAAYAKAVQAAADPGIQSLLEHRPFQEEVASGLLDPLGGFNLQALADRWSGSLPDHALPLRRFFNTLQNALLMDETWGPALERYQSLRASPAARQAAQAQGFPTDDRLLVKQVSLQISQNVNAPRLEVAGGGAIAQGERAVAVGQEGVYIGGGVGGDVIAADGTKISLPSPEEQAQKAQQAARHRYPWSALLQLACADGDVPTPEESDEYYQQIRGHSRDSLKGRFFQLTEEAKKLVKSLSSPR